MLAELEQQRYEFDFGGVMIAMRYTLADFLALEKLGIAYMDIFAEKLTADKILEFFYVGLVEKLPDEVIEKLVECVGFEMIWEYCRGAMEQALPKRDPSILYKPRPADHGEFSFARLRALVCDVMGKSEEFFWGSTLAELLERWQEYAVAMGYAEEPERIMEYDDEGM